MDRKRTTECRNCDDVISLFRNPKRKETEADVGGRTGTKARNSEQQSLLPICLFTSLRIEKTTNPTGKEKNKHDWTIQTPTMIFFSGSRSIIKLRFYQTDAACLCSGREALGERRHYGETSHRSSTRSLRPTHPSLSYTSWAATDCSILNSSQQTKRPNIIRCT